MARKWWLALLALALVTPAMAQLVMRPIQRPVAGQPMTTPDTSAQQESGAATKIMTIEEARAKIAELNRKNRDLDGKLTEALATIDQWTKKGGSLVHAYCESDTISRSSAGDSEDCSASGYACSPVEGTC